MTTSVTINPSLDRKLNGFRQRVQSVSRETLIELGEDGKQYARSIAPKRPGSGLLVRNIILRKSNSEQVAIVSQNPMNSYVGEPRKHGKFGPGKFNLPQWAAESPEALTHFNTGKARYMALTALYLKKKLGNTFRTNLKTK
jgi:hypothetical protein